jgi:hypothetical protein
MLVEPALLLGLICLWLAAMDPAFAVLSVAGGAILAVLLGKGWFSSAKAVSRG